MTAVERNLDKISAEIGFELAETFKGKTDAEKLETLITKALGILIEDGLLAYTVWLKSKKDKEKEYSEKILEKSINLLTDDRIMLTNKKDLEDLQDIILNDISTDIQKTLLARQLLERMLVYARYRAKALQKESE